MDNLDCAALEKGASEQEGGKRKGGKGTKIEGRGEKGGAEERHVLDFLF